MIKMQEKINVRTGNELLEKFSRISIAEVLDIILKYFVKGVSAFSAFRDLKNIGSTVAIKTINNMKFE